LNGLDGWNAPERRLIEDLIRLFWQQRQVLVDEVDLILRAASDLPPTPAAAIAAAVQTSPLSGREELKQAAAAEVVRDRAVAAVLLAAPEWIEAAAHRNPPWGRTLTRAVSALNDARTISHGFLDTHRSVLQQHARCLAADPT
jgi:hypothetical protein